MDKLELKKMLKPLIKECIKDVILEEGVLSSIISEVIRGTSKGDVLREREDSMLLAKESQIDITKEKQKRLQEARDRMTEAIGSDAYEGVFDGMTPMSSAGAPSEQAQASHAISGYSSEDAGVNISGLLSVAGAKWGKLRG